MGVIAMSDYHVSVGDRLRTLTNEELATTLVEYITGVIANSVDKFNIEFTPNKPKYIEILLKQLAENTTEKPRQYTVEELKAMRGEKIYICHINACAGFYHDLYAPYYGDKEQYVENNVFGLTTCHLPLSHYGTSWIAFAYKPRDIDDKNIPLAEYTDSYDETTFEKMSTCQLVNEQHRIKQRLETPELPKETIAALTRENIFVNWELERRRKNDLL
jgi:hypothetical protein